ncbi:MAG: YdeI/OmpD-associated family protein [Candidatus Saccharibacteria bacterium]|nr:YdeI/OmpD-associated family protein [Candidatus Saccharibacteria bacterium]
MDKPEIPGGTIHKLPADLQKALAAHPAALVLWSDITPLARNEWICWVEGAKLIETRDRRVERVHKELIEGKRRPCCWPGCIHRERNGK